MEGGHGQWGLELGLRAKVKGRCHLSPAMSTGPLDGSALHPLLLISDQHLAPPGVLEGSWESLWEGHRTKINCFPSLHYIKASRRERFTRRAEMSG